ncbi:MAG: FAD-dependent oxidoreductase [Polyangiaceae bacterium]
MESVKTLIVGAGVSGLATAAALSDRGDHDLLELEADSEIGGYCKTVTKDGFVWDYSGHFFHFKNKEIETWLREHMKGQKIRDVAKRSFIHYKGAAIDFPFQKNIHQLPKDEFIDCIHDLYFARAPQELLGKNAPKKADETNFKEMLYGRFGKSIAEKFLIPYNEKLYATDLSSLDKDAMGRFFPHADLTDIVRNMKEPDNASYNAAFTYPEGGAIQYVHALASAVKPESIVLNEALVSIDLETKIATTSKREIHFERLVSSAPFPNLLKIAGEKFDASIFSWNKVLVFNLGFDSKGDKSAHWVYFPDRECVFYRIGYYDNIFDTDRMSLYVEVGFSKDAKVDVEAMRVRVLEDLKKNGVITTQKLIASHSVVMDPAYVHITQASMAEHAKLSAKLAARGVHAIGRYGGWKYCSIEDNIVEARALVDSLA